MVNLPLHYLSYNGNIYCTDYMVYVPLCFCSYSIMRQCWEADCSKRPSFSHLRKTFTAMLSNAQNATYINLNVDEMLPCYSMKTEVEDEACELTDRDLRPFLTGIREGEGVNTDGYQTLEPNNDDAIVEGYDILVCKEGADTDPTIGYHTLERCNDDDDDSSSADVIVLGSAGERKHI